MPPPVAQGGHGPDSGITQSLWVDCVVVGDESPAPVAHGGHGPEAGISQAWLVDVVIIVINIIKSDKIIIEVTGNTFFCIGHVLLILFFASVS